MDEPVRPVILVVEDDESIRTVIKMALEMDGMACLTAGNGQAALELLRTERPDAILFDLMMPVMNGWELALKLEEDPALRSIPTIVLTASRSNLNLPADHVLMKPCDVDHLLEVVRHAVLEQHL